MITHLVALQPLADHPGGQLTRSGGEETAGLGDGTISKGVILRHLKGIHNLLGEFVGRESSPDIDQFHGVSNTSADSDTLPSLVHSLLEVTGPVLARSTMEVDAPKGDP